MPLAFMTAVAIAAETSGITFETVKPILDAITDIITWDAIIAVLGGVLGVSVVFAFSWWAARKGVRMLMGAFKKGKVSV